ncbi:MAG: pseudouridine synthase [Bacteroidia bacterium]
MDDHEQSGSGPRNRKAAGQSSGAGPDRKTRIASKRKELQRWEEGTGDEKSKWIQRELDQMFASGDSGRPSTGSVPSTSAGGGRSGKEMRSFDLPRSTGRRDTSDGGYQPRGRRDGDSGFAPRGRREGDSDYRPRPPRDGNSGFAPRARRDGDSGYQPRARRDGDTGYQPRGRRDDSAFEPRVRNADMPKRENAKIRIPKTSEHPIRGKAPKSISFDTPMRLNRFVANSGLCSRRRADELIEGGQIMVDGAVVNVLGSRVSPGSVVTYQGTVLRLQNLVYVLLNKPKDYITTTDDPEDRKTVMSLVEEASRERILPVGRLDRNTTGLLLMTNDGELAQKLTHPSFEISKVYDVGLDKPLSRTDFEKIAAGITLDDGLAEIDAIAYPNPDDPTQVGIELHIGRNRIVRRIFESLGYDVVRLDRVVYAGLTKKDLPRGQWRYLTPREVSRLLK